MQNRSLKVVLIGHAEEKRKFIRELSQLIYTGQYLRSAPIGLDFMTFEYNKLKFQIWDMPGVEKFFSLTKCYLKDAKAIIFVNADLAQKQAVTSDPSNKAIVMKDFDSTNTTILDCLQEVASQIQNSLQLKKGTTRPEKGDRSSKMLQVHNHL